MATQSAALRGIEAVEKIIALQQQEDVLGVGDPVPLSKDAIAKLSPPGGRALPPSVARWLEYDSQWLPWVEDGTLRSFSLDGIIEVELDEFSAAPFRALAQTKLEAPCLRLTARNDTQQLIYLGTPDAFGEYPVLWIDTEDVPGVGLYSPDFGVWLLEKAGLIDGFERETYESLADHPPYTDAMDAAAQANLGGVLTLELGDAAFPGDASGEPTVQVKVFGDAEEK